MRYLLTLIIIFIIHLLNLQAQVSIPNIVRPLRVGKKHIKLDGKLEEGCWQEAQRITNFHQREVFEGQKVTERTEVAVCYSETEIYIGFWCYESDIDGIVAKHMERDFNYWNDDNFEIIFDTFHDKRNGYVFVVNPNGARSDVLITDEGKGFNKDWNGIWDARVIINEKGWFGEIVIPFSTLKYKQDSIATWGVNFERNIRRKQEQAFWQGWSQDYDFEHVSHAGILEGMLNIRGKELLELKPFITSGMEIKKSSDISSVTKIGGDINYSITPRMKLNLTINTDFAQIESDVNQINLSRFSLYYPEKRDFFLEGKYFFEMNMENGAQLFYSRRIGINPYDNSKMIPIMAGLRAIGQVGQTSIGAMSMQLSSQDSIASTNYSVIRLRQNIFNKSNIGMILTSKINEGHQSFAYGVDFNYFTSKVFGNKNLNIKAVLTQSLSNEVESNDNYAYQFSIDYPNELYNAEIGFQSIGYRFNPEIGYLRRSDFHSLWSDFKYRPRPAWSDWIKRFNFQPYSFKAFWNKQTGDLETYNLSIRPISIQNKHGDSFNASFSYNYDSFDESFLVADRAEIPAGEYNYGRYHFSVNSFHGRYLSGSSGISFGNYYNGFLSNYNMNINYSLNEHLRMSGSFEQNFIDISDEKFSTYSFVSRVDYAFNPRLISGVFAQWNNVTESAVINFRFHWIPSLGSNFYLAVNQYITEDRSISIENTSILAKLVWRFGI